MLWRVPGGIIRDASTLALFVTWGVCPLPTSQPISAVAFQAVGDSLTSWEGLEFSGQPRIDVSWTETARGDGTIFMGGWARGGAESGDILANMPDIVPGALVVLAGTNDINHGVAQSVTITNIAAIAAQANGLVVISAVPPLNLHPDEASKLNDALSLLAEDNSWTFVDPWVSFRDAGGMWVGGASPDGVHPDRATADRAGHVIHNVVLYSRR